MKITSSAFNDNSPLPSKYTCAGENINPPLEFMDIPASAKSLALIMEDPDAVSNPPYFHWLLFNMSPNILFIKEGEEPSNSQKGLNSSGSSGYFGACPPKNTGDHRYIFRIYALDIVLEDMPEFTDHDILAEAIHGHVIEQASITGIYKRQ